MVNVRINEAAGAYGFEVLEYNMKITGRYTSLSFNELKYGDSKSDYVDLHGSFSFKGGMDAYSVIKSVSSLSLVDAKQKILDMTGLDIVKADVKNLTTLKAYFASESYVMTGNSYANTLAGANLNDSLSGNGGNDKLFGLGGKDKLDGGDGNDVLTGGDQNDNLLGQIGNDLLLGGNGNDLLNGHNGFDRLNGGTGNDSMTGGASDDTFVFVKGCGTDAITDFDAIGKAHDLIDFAGYKGLDTFKDLHLVRDGRDVVIDLAGADEIVLQGVGIRDLDKTDFHF